jgi:hypothetical protein
MPPGTYALRHTLKTPETKNHGGGTTTLKAATTEPAYATTAAWERVSPCQLQHTRHTGKPTEMEAGTRQQWPFRVYRDTKGNIYSSVTHILGQTSDRTGLEQWVARTDKFYGAGAAIQERDVAAKRGNLAHNQAEYLLKTAQRLARSTANKRNALKWDTQGLARIPPPITQWALNKVHPNMPEVGWSASGYARGLSGWIQSNVTEIFASEFSIHHPAGFAGTCDALVSLKGHNGIMICDWKTSNSNKLPYMNSDHQYVHQLGAYSLGLQNLTSLKPVGGAVVLARRTGDPDVYFVNKEELEHAERAYLARVKLYNEQQAAGSVGVLL